MVMETVMVVLIDSAAILSIWNMNNQIKMNTRVDGSGVNKS